MHIGTSECVLYTIFSSLCTSHVCHAHSIVILIGQDYSAEGSNCSFRPPIGSLETELASFYTNRARVTIECLTKQYNSAEVNSTEDIV